MMSSGGLTRRNRLALISGLCAFLVLAGTGVASAVWTSAASVTGSVAAAVTSLTVAGTPSLSTTYAFAGTAAQSPTIVRTMVVTNTGSAPLNYSLAVTGVAGNALAPLVKLTLWVTTGTCSTTAGTGATSGTLAAPPVLPSGALTATPGGKFTLCASTSLNSTIVASQGLSVTPTLTIIGTVGTSTWNTDTSDAPFTQTVYKMSDPTSLTCTQAKKAQSVTLSWTAPVNYGSTGNLSYQVVDTSGKLIPSQPGTQTTVSIGSSDVSNTMQTFFVQAKEDLYGSTSTGISITLTQNSQGNSGKISCP
jgi:hypothetical protein